MKAPERLQPFEGVVLSVKNRGLGSSFIVRKISNGIGVERTFQTHSPIIGSITVKRRGDVRQAKLFTFEKELDVLLGSKKNLVNPILAHIFLMSLSELKSENLIDIFIDELWLEKGLSKNTLSAYRHDLSSFSKWYKGKSLLDVERVDLLDYLASRLKDGYSSRSTARSLSSLRAFYSHLTTKHNLEKNPTDKVESPKLGHSLPKTLSEDEVDRLINAPDVEDDIGLRDRAMLELIYACGLRVSGNS